MSHCSFPRVATGTPTTLTRNRTAECTGEEEPEITPLRFVTVGTSSRGPLQGLNDPLFAARALGLSTHCPGPGRTHNRDANTPPQIPAYEDSVALASFFREENHNAISKSRWIGPKRLMGIAKTASCKSRFVHARVHRRRWKIIHTIHRPCAPSWGYARRRIPDFVLRMRARHGAHCMQRRDDHHWAD